MIEINFDSYYKNLANQTLNWLIMDTQERYEDNLKNNFEKLNLNGWVNKTIEYKFNSHGFRSDEFNDEENIMFLGCSETMGIGLNIKDSWTHIVSNELRLKSYNLGIGGGSPDTCFRMCLGWIDRLKPKLVVFRRPPGIRVELVSESRVENMVLSNINNDPNKEWLIRNWAMDENNNELNYRKNLLAISHICNERKIQFIETDEKFKKRFDLARDLLHVGIKSNEYFAKKVLDVIKNTII